MYVFFRKFSTYKIYDGQFTLVLLLLIEQEEVEVDDVVLLGHDAAEEFCFKMRKERLFEPVKQVMHRVRTVLKEQLKQRPVLFQLFVHPCQLHLLA